MNLTSHGKSKTRVKRYRSRFTP